MKQTLAIIKPDAVARGIVGEILTLIEGSELTIDTMEMCILSKATVEELYREHYGRDYYDRLIAFMAGPNPSVVMALSGPAGREIPSVWRHLMADIRRLYVCNAGPANLVHGSDSEAAALRELTLFWPVACSPRLL